MSDDKDKSDCGDYEKENRNVKRLCVDSPSAVLSPGSRIPAKKALRLSALAESRRCKILNSGDPNLESTVLESSFSNNDLKIGDANLEMTALEDTFSAFEKNRIAMVGRSNLESTKLDETITESSENVSTLNDSDTGLFSDIHKSTANEVSETFKAEVVENANYSEEQSTSYIEAADAINSTYVRQNVCSEPPMMRNCDSIQPIEVKEQSGNTTDTLIDVPKMLEAKKKEVKLNSVNPPSTPRSLAQYTRERVSDYSFIISEAYCEKEVFCENCYKMRVEFQELADKFSNLLLNSSSLSVDKNADQTSVQRLEEAVNAANKKLLDVVEDRDRLQKEVEQLKADLVSVEKKRSFAEKDLDDYKFFFAQELQKAKDSNRQKSSKICELETQLSEFRENNSQKNSQIAESLQVKVDELIAEKRMLEEKLESIQSRSVLSEDIEALTTELSAAEKVILELRGSTELLCAEKKDLESKLVDSLEMRNQQEKSIQSLEKEKEDLLEKLVSMEEVCQAQSSEVINTLKIELSTAHTTISQLRQEIDSVVSEKSSVEGKLSDSMGLQIQLEELIKSVETENENLTGRIASLEETLKTRDALSGELEVMKTELSAAQTTISQLEREVKSLIDERNTLRGKLDESLRYRLDLEKSMKFIEKEKEDLLGKVISMEENTVPVAEYESVKAELTSVLAKAELSVVKKENIALKEEVRSCSVEQARLSSICADLESKLEFLGKETRHLNDQNEALRKTVDTNEEILASFKKVEKLFGEKWTSLTNSMSSENASREIGMLTKENEVLKEKVSELIRSSQKLEEQLSKTEEEKQKFFVKLQLMEQNCVEKSEYQLLKNDISAVNLKFAELEQTYNLSVSEVQTLTKRLTEKDEDIEKARRFKAEVENQLSLARDEKEKLLLEYRNLTEKAKLLEKEVECIKEAKQLLSVELATLRESLGTVKESKELSDLREETTTLNTTIDILKRNLHEAEERIICIEKEKQELISKVEVLEQVSAVNHQHNALETQLSEEQTKVAELQQALETSRDAMRNLMDNLTSKTQQLEEVLLQKNETKAQTASLGEENKKLIETNNVLGAKIEMQANEIQELKKRTSYLEKQNERLGDACDEADGEITELRKELFDMKLKQARIEGAQKGLTEEEIMCNVGCINYQGPSIMKSATESKTSQAETDEVNGTSTPVKNLPFVGKDDTISSVLSTPNTTTASKGGSTKKQKSECRQQ